MASNEALEALRKQIDALDEQIVQLLNQRAAVAQEIGEAKRQTQESIYAPDREVQVLRRVEGHSQGPLTPESLRRIYQELISACRASEHPIRVCYLGPPATFTHFAAETQFGEWAQLMPVRDIISVFAEVSRESADYGVVPFENSTEGSVDDTLDAFFDYELKICAEITQPVHHDLLSTSDVAHIEKVYSNPQALAQCKNWLASHLPEVELAEVTSTARAAEMAAKETKSAAVAHPRAGQLYGLNVVSRGIEDYPHNVTRFAVIGRQATGPSGTDKTSVMFSIQHEAGSLYKALEPFHRHGVNLTRIESRPSKRRAWEYYFFIDFEGHAEEEAPKKALTELEALCYHMRVLGSYPKADRT